MKIKAIRSPVKERIATFGILALLAGGAIALAVQLSSPLYLIAGALAILVFLASLLSVEFGLVFLVFLTYTRLSDIAFHYHNAPSVAKAFVFLLGVVILVRWAIFHERPEGWQRVLILGGIYTLVCLPSLFFASDISRVMEALSDLVKDVAIALIIVILLANGRRMRMVIWALLVAAIFIGTISVYQYLTGSFDNNFWGFGQTKFMQYVGDVEGYRIAGPVGDPNFFAQVMVVLVPLALERFINERNRWLRLCALWAMLASALTVIFTFSRGGFLALCAALFIWCAIYPPKMKFWPLIFLAGVVIFLLTPQVYIDRIFTLEQLFSGSAASSTQDDALRGRTSELLSSLEMIKDSPILGVGLGNYTVHYAEYAQRFGLAPSAGERAAHNLYLEIAAETGLLGLTVFLFILGTLARGVNIAWRRFKEAGRFDLAALTVAFGAGLGGYLTAALFVHSAYARYFWLLAGIAFSLEHILRNELAAARR